MKLGATGILLVVMTAFTMPAQAAEIRSLHNYNINPFQQLFGLPSLDNNTVSKQGEWRARLIGSISNTYTIRVRGNEAIILDHETYKYILNVDYGLTPQWQLGVGISYISHSDGFLDDYIYKWHDVFDLPQNGRSKSNSGFIRYYYSRDGVVLVDISRPQNGFGDIRLKASYSKPVSDRTLIVSSELKLPTGDIEKLTGSGGTDISVGLVINDAKSLSSYDLVLFGGVGVVYMGDIDSSLSTIQTNSALTGRLGVGWQATSFLQLILQYDTHTSLYDSELREIGEPAGQLVVGGNLKINTDISLDLAIAEDIFTSSAPDVVFQLGLTINF
jgi:hypothetical protein